MLYNCIHLYTSVPPLGSSLLLSLIDKSRACLLYQMIPACHQYHSGQPGVHIFPVEATNWYTVTTDTAYEGWIHSLSSLVTLPKGVESFLLGLLVHPQGPIIHLDEPNRSEAPIFTVARMRSCFKRHTRFMQFGCRYCQHQTQLLYPGATAEEAKYAIDMLLLFFKPLLDRAMYSCVKHQRISLANIVDNPMARNLTIGATRVSEITQEEDMPVATMVPQKIQGLKGKRVWTKYQDGLGNNWWHNAITEDFFFESTGTRDPPCKSWEKICGKTGIGSDDDLGPNESSTQACSDGTESEWSMSLSSAPSIGCSANTAISGLSSLRIGVYEGRCTHRTYAKNLYSPGQQPSLPEIAGRDCTSTQIHYIIKSM